MYNLLPINAGQSVVLLKESSRQEQNTPKGSKVLMVIMRTGDDDNKESR